MTWIDDARSALPPALAWSLVDEGDHCVTFDSEDYEISVHRYGPDRCLAWLAGPVAAYEERESAAAAVEAAFEVAAKAWSIRAEQAEAEIKRLALRTPWDRMAETALSALPDSDRWEVVARGPEPSVTLYGMGAHVRIARLYQDALTVDIDEHDGPATGRAEAESDADLVGAVRAACDRYADSLRETSRAYADAANRWDAQ